MKPIELVDLKNQYLKIKDEVDREVLNVLDSCHFINGPTVKQFAANLEKYLDVKHVIPCGNGTDALQIALMALDLKPGDEVITPSFTYIATSEVAALLGLNTVFIDVDKRNFTIDPSSLESAISNKTKAIIPVHLYGHCANMEEIMAIAQKHNIPVVEDTAQALGAYYLYKDGTKKKAGTIGTIGCTSFFPSKNLGAYGDGGAMFTNDDALAEKIRMISNHGQSKKYYHDVIGVNSRLDSIQAAILNVKLRYLDQYCEERQRVAQYFNEAFSEYQELITPITEPFSTHVFHQYTLQLKGIDRDAFQKYLEEQGVPSNVYYPLPNHLQKGFINAPGRKVDLSNTEVLMKNVVSLPIHTEMTDDQLLHITKVAINFCQSKKLSKV